MHDEDVLIRSGFNQKQATVVTALFRKFEEESIRRRMDACSRSSRSYENEVRVMEQGIKDEISVLRNSTIKLFDTSMRVSDARKTSERIAALEKEALDLQKEVTRLTARVKSGRDLFYFMSVAAVTLSALTCIHLW